MVAKIEEVIIDRSPGVKFDDIKGLASAKQTLKETIVLPSLRPDIFTGARSPNKGILLFGPPGNGKTLIAKAVASECNATFFNLSASILVSKFMGESEKLMRTLFTIAADKSPAIIFIDEIDSILRARSSDEHEATRRIKTEFLIQFDGVSSSADARILVIGATNRPEDLDEAVLRRFTSKIFISMPEDDARQALFEQSFSRVKTQISKKELAELVRLSVGYSGADISAVCKEACFEPVREISPDKLLSVQEKDIRPVSLDDFLKALKKVQPSVSKKTLKDFEEFKKNT